MYNLVREHRSLLYGPLDTTVLRIEEFVSGRGAWPAKYRFQVSAANQRPAKSFYGRTSHVVAKQAAKHLANFDAKTKRLSRMLKPFNIK
jgi:hypothetical protein